MASNLFSESERQMFKDETSRTVKIGLLKLKCVIIMAIAILAIVQFIYIIFREIASNEKHFQSILSLTNAISNMSRKENLMSTFQSTNKND